MVVPPCRGYTVSNPNLLHIDFTIINYNGEIERKYFWVLHSLYPTHTSLNRKETIAERGACRDLITKKKGQKI